jgi:hypothetical protein
MDQRKLTYLITHLIIRIREFPPEAVRELLTAVDQIERKHDLREKLTAREWEAVVESRDSLSWAEQLAAGQVSKSNITKVDLDAWGAQNFEEAFNRVQKRDGEQQGDIADVIFALQDEYLI